MTDSCRSTHECPPAKACRLAKSGAGRCEAQPVDGVLGSFQCLVSDCTLPGNGPDCGRPTADASADILGVSEVGGTLGTDVVPLYSYAFCSIVEDATGKYFGGGFGAQAVGLGFDLGLTFGFPVEDAAAGGALQLVSATTFGEPSTAILDLIYSDDEDPRFSRRTIAFAWRGELRLDRAPRDGQWLSGYAEIDLDLVRFPPALGVPCPRGVAVCGLTWDLGYGSPWSLPAYPVCEAPPVPGAATALCSVDCSTDPTGCGQNHVCVADRCLLPCAATSECPAPLTCRAGPAAGDPMVCY